jgi:hypothetical protein
VPKLDGPREEGIPLAWVPRPELVAELVGAPDLVSRDSILVANRADIAVDCRRVLDEVTAPDAPTPDNPPPQRP